MTEIDTVSGALVPSAPDPIAQIRSRILERERQIENLQPQIARSEQFANELRGKLFTAQAQYTELTELLTALQTDAKASSEKPDATPHPNP